MILRVSQVLISNKRWILPENDYQDGNIAQFVLDERGLSTDLSDFIDISEAMLYDPFLMKGMRKAVTRIKSALENNEKILIYGDYDADGVTATSLLLRVLKRLNAQVSYYIPNRFTEGYGLQLEVIDMANNNGTTLIITVDTGIAAVQEVKYAHNLGIDVIITDHHEAPQIVPDAFVILNPKYRKCEYPEPDLAGVGVACKLATALLGELPYSELDLVAVGTVADLVKLQGENRVLVGLGLKKINQDPLAGIKALLSITGLEGKEITAGNLGFQLAPRINASGRLETADYSVALLNTDDYERALLVAEELHEINARRQALVEEIWNEVEQIIADESLLEKQQVLVITKQGWNHGVIGIVASKVVEKYYRPTIMISIEDGVGKGSARSIKGFHLFEALTDCEDILIKYGGHAMAAGLTIAQENIMQLQERLNVRTREILTEQDFIPVTNVDLMLSLPELLSKQTEIADLARLAPFGMGNPHPRTLLTGVRFVSGRIIGKNQDHVKLSFIGSSTHIDVIAFKKADVMAEYLQKTLLKELRFDLLGEVELNEWNGKVSPQLVLQDVALAPVQFIHREYLDDLQKFLTSKGILTHICQVDTLESIEEVLLACYQSGVRGKKVYIFDAQLEGLIKEKHGNYLQRDDFALAYRIIQTYSGSPEHKIIEIALNEGLPAERLRIMVVIFEELGLISCSNKVLSIKNSTIKKNLEESKNYQKHKQLVMQINRHFD